MGYSFSCLGSFGIGILLVFTKTTTQILTFLLFLYDSAWGSMKKYLILTFFVQQMGYLIKKKVFLLSRMTGNVRL